MNGYQRMQAKSSSALIMVINFSQAGTLPAVSQLMQRERNLPTPRPACLGAREEVSGKVKSIRIEEIRYSYTNPRRELAGRL
jgi:hypothetical protein